MGRWKKKKKRWKKNSTIMNKRERVKRESVAIRERAENTGTLQSVDFAGLALRCRKTSVG